ncbi:MAG: FMN-binding protein, partial [Spirochaetaceae bacterium]|nr:FMN-binding protein [Spirochaetaceae bacterium]
VTQEAPKAVVVKDGSYEDGIYFATEDSFASNGWKYVVTLAVENGKITKADWNGVNVSAGPSKKAVDKAGKYNMKKLGGALADWSEEAAKVEQYLIKTQDPSVISYKDDKGHTDDIAGVSIHVVEFFELAQKALANSPVGKGMYEDGAYFMADSEFPDSGWKNYVALTVINGNIVGANWSAIDTMGEDKKLFDAAGKYNMVKFGGAQAEWSEQATKAEQYLIDIQDPSLVKYIDEEGHTDAISGVSIHISGFMALVNAALKAGPVVLGPYTDGGYYATQDAFDNGWKEYVSLFVKNGNIVNVYWSALNKEGEDKKAFDMAGNYNMVKFGGAQAEWYEQAALVEQHLLKTQDVSAISYKDDAGHTDDISGASIHVSGFYELVAKALNNGVVTIE